MEPNWKEHRTVCHYSLEMDGYLQAYYLSLVLNRLAVMRSHCPSSGLARDLRGVIDSSLLIVIFFLVPQFWDCCLISRLRGFIRKVWDDAAK